MRFPFFFASHSALFALLACQAQVKANAEANVGHEEVADFNKPLDHPVGAEGPAFEDSSRGEALLGARPDLSFRGPPTATCHCLAVAVGQPGDAPFQWNGEQPHTNPDSQLVIALSSSGVACPEASANALGASYWGYEMQRDDVVVVVEPATTGRPLTTGAIIPRPVGAGRVYVRPADKKVPYGRAASGGGMCSIGAFARAETKPSPSIPPPAGSARVRIGGSEPPADSPKVDMP